MPVQPYQCLSCGKSEQAVPLITLRYRSETIWICPQCLPLLIHAPHKLAGKLPGAETMGGTEHSH